MNDKLSFQYGISSWYKEVGVGISCAWSLEDAEFRYRIDIKRSGKVEKDISKIVMEKQGYIFTGNSKYQAEVALNYLKTNYPDYTEFRLIGTGVWDDPYCAVMKKTIRTYDVFYKRDTILPNYD